MIKQTFRTPLCNQFETDLQFCCFFIETVHYRREDKVDKKPPFLSTAAVRALITTEKAGLTGTTDI